MIFFNTRLWTLAALALCYPLGAVAWAGSSAILSWSPSPATNAAGYFFYTGPQFGNYTSKVDVKTNTTATVSGSNGESTYYCAVTAYDAQGDESEPCNQVTVVLPVEGMLQLAPIPDQYVDLPQTLSVATFTTDTNQPLFFNLAPGAPAGMMINPATGVLTWTPSILQAGTINPVTVQVTDSGVPPLTDAQTFQVAVGNAFQLNLSSAVISAGQTGSVTVNLQSSGPISALIFDLTVVADWAGSVSAQSLTTNAVINQYPPGGINSTFVVQTSNGQPFQGIQDIIRLQITSTPQSVPGFGAIFTSNIFAWSQTFQPLAGIAGPSSKLVFIGQHSFMEGSLVNGIRKLVLYGQIGENYEIESTTNLQPPAIWASEFITTLTNSYQCFSLATNDTTKFYRARSLD